MNDTSAPSSSGSGDPQRPGRRGLVLAGLLALGLLAAGGGVWWWLSGLDGSQDRQAAPPRPPVIRTAGVTAADEIEIAQTGFVRPVFQVDVVPEISARIAALGPDFRVGGRVAEGDLLVRLERDRLEASLAEAEAGVQQAQAALTEARNTLRRQEELAEEDFASEARLQDAVVGESRAEADLAAARAARTQARQALDDATIAAPFDALVTARGAAVGQAVSPGAVLGTLVATEAAEVRFGLTPRDRALLGDTEAALGRSVAIHPAGPGSGAPLATGTVTDTDPRVAEGSRTAGLIVRIEGAFAARDPRPLRVDELVALRLPVPLDGIAALSVPAEAVKAGDILFRIVPAGEDSPDGTARLRRVPATILYRTGTRAILTAQALAPGDRVMLSDRAGVLDGERVRLAEAGSGQAGDTGGGGDRAGRRADDDPADRQAADAAGGG